MSARRDVSVSFIPLLSTAHPAMRIIQQLSVDSFSSRHTHTYIVCKRMSVQLYSLIQSWPFKRGNLLSSNFTHFCSARHLRTLVAASNYSITQYYIKSRARVYSVGIIHLYYIIHIIRFAISSLTLYNIICNAAAILCVY